MAQQWEKPRDKNRLWGRYPTRKDYPILIPILLLGTYFRLDGLNEPGLWLDEVAYTIAAQKPIINQIIKPTETLGGYLSVDPTLSAIPFSLSLKLGFQNFLVRLPAALFGILSIAALYKLGQKMFGNLVGLISALLLATNQFHILYSQEARSYTQFIFFTILSFFFLYLIIEKNSAKNSYWFLYTLSIWAGVSTNHLMIFTVGIQFTSLVLIYLNQRFLRGTAHQTETRLVQIMKFFLVSVIVVALFRVPWLSDFTDRQCAGCDIGDPSTSLIVFPYLISTFQAFTNSTSMISFMVIALYVLGLILIGYYSKEVAILLVSWSLFAIVATIVGLWFISQFFQPRYTLWALPAIFLVVAYTLVSIGILVGKALKQQAPSLFIERTQITVIALLVVPIIGFSLYQTQFNAVNKQLWPIGQLQEVTNKIVTEANSQDVVINFGMPALYLQYYVEQARQDLLYLDANNFQQAPALLPESATVWYVIHIDPPFNAPTVKDSLLEYETFNDLMVVKISEECQLVDCINDTKILLLDIANANPNSRFTTRINGALSALSTLQ
ncbi:MAG: glycosyltransferase family 39 protein [Chloroflexota bacterium]